jgi:hypothetical protein
MEVLMKIWMLVLVASCLVVGVLAAVKAYSRNDGVMAVSAGLVILNGIVWSIHGKRGSLE